MILEVVVYCVMSAFAAGVVVYTFTSDAAAKKYRKLQDAYGDLREKNHTLTKQAALLNETELERDRAQVMLRRVESLRHAIRDDGMISGAALHEEIGRIIDGENTTKG